MGNTFPSSPDDGAYAGYTSGPLSIDPKGSQMIGGTHNVSVRVDPDSALRGGYTAIPGDTMPAGAPAVGPGTNSPYMPSN